MQKKYTFPLFLIIILTPFPVFPHSVIQYSQRDSLITYSGIPKFIPDPNIDYKILESVADSTIDYKILKSNPDKFFVPGKSGIFPDSLIKKYHIPKKFKK